MVETLAGRVLFLPDGTNQPLKYIAGEAQISLILNHIDQLGSSQKWAVELAEFQSIFVMSGGYQSEYLQSWKDLRQMKSCKIRLNVLKIIKLC